jgi:P27 family predicted phage terminase small subunit
MGRRGPAPKPTILKLVGGNPGKRPLNTEEPVPPTGPIDPPPLVCLDAEAKGEWDRLVPTLQSTGIARPLDLAVLVQWCVTWSRFKKAAEFIAKGTTTLIVRNPQGVIVGVKELPQAKEFRQLQQLLIILSRELGITPAARSRITSIDPKAKKGKSETDLRRRFFGGA